MTDTYFFSVKAPDDLMDFLICWYNPEKNYEHLRELVPYIRSRAKAIIDKCRTLLRIQMNYRLETKRIRTHMEK